MHTNYELVQLNLLKLRTGQELGSHHNLSSGMLGEESFLTFIKRYGHTNWTIYGDYWFHYGKRMQVDFLVITSDRWLVVEVKHYDGMFEYKDNERYLNGRLMDDNYLSSMDLRVKKIRHIAHSFHPNLTVEGLMVFIHENAEIDIQSDYAFDFQIKLRHQLKGYFSRLKRSDNQKIADSYLRQIDGVLNKHRVQNPFLPKPISRDQWISLTKGINCHACDHFDMNFQHKAVICNTCGAIERKDAAVMRMADQLRILFYGDENAVTGARIYELCDRKISLNTIHRILKNTHE